MIEKSDREIIVIDGIYDMYECVYIYIYIITLGYHCNSQNDILVSVG